MKGYRDTEVWRRAVGCKKIIYELCDCFRLVDSWLWMDMRNTIDIMCFGIMMAFEYVDEASVLESLDSSRGKAYRLTSMINSCNAFGYLDKGRTHELGLGLGAIVVMIDCLVADVKSGFFWEE